MIDFEDEETELEKDKVSLETDGREEERRKSYRLNKVLGATLTSPDGDSTSTRLFVIDISTTGFRATDHRPPGEGDCLISIVLIKGEEPFESKIRIVWVKELTVSGMYQMGCEFVDTTEEQLARLASFIEGEQNKVATPGGASFTFRAPWTLIS